MSAAATAIRLGVNVDHAATLRNARGGRRPDPVEVALAAARGGADRITAHLREDRRHIQDADIARLKEKTGLPLNFEMAPTDEMLAFACAHKPKSAMMVPEKREELTTEGGLDVAGHEERLAFCAGKLRDSGIEVSFFIDPDEAQTESASRAGADSVEFHTGPLCAAEGKAREKEIALLRKCAARAHQMGLEVHAGHGLDFETARLAASLPHLRELNIGHFLIGAALIFGMEEAVRRMRRAIASGAEAGAAR